MSNCRCAHSDAATAAWVKVLRSGDFTGTPMAAQPTRYAEIIAARGLAHGAPFPIGLAHDSAVRAISLSVRALGWDAVTEVAIRDRPRPKRVDLVVYPDGHTCAASALMLVEYKPAIRRQSQALAAVAQIKEYGERWARLHDTRPRLAIVAERADDWVSPGIETYTPDQFLHEMRVEATLALIGEAAAA